MADIATQLKTARTEAGIDIATAEDATKIRSKYLRAFESGNWAVLPDETSAKSFLRTYADYLGLDGRALVEVFKASQISRGDSASYSPIESRGNARRGWGWRMSVIAALVLALIVGLFLIGINSDAAQADAFVHASTLGTQL